MAVTRLPESPLPGEAGASFEEYTYVTHPEAWKSGNRINSKMLRNSKVKVFQEGTEGRWISGLNW